MKSAMTIHPPGAKILFALGLMLVLTVGITPHVARAVTVGFDVNTVSADPLFTYTLDANNNIRELETLSPTTVDLTIVPHVPDTFAGASFDFEADVTAVNPLGPSAYEYQFTGEFSFREAGTNDLIFQVDFVGARMIFFESLGQVIFATGPGANTNVVYTAGPALHGATFGGAQEFSFTLSDLQDLSGGAVDNLENLPDVELESFTFNSSFSGLADLVEVPEPATLPLTAIGILGLIAAVRRRRR